MDVKRTLVNPMRYLEEDEFGDKEKIEIMEYIDQQYDYDFYNDEIIELEKTFNPMYIIPQEGLRYSIINIMAYVLGDVINDYMLNYTKQSNSYSPNRKCLIIMKNEFLFKRILLMDAKKNYATIQEVQEGNMVPHEEGLDIKGLPMTKSGTNKRTQERLKEILYEDILNAEHVDQVKVLKNLAIFEKEIYNALQSGDKKFYKPVRIKSFTAYENPMRIQGIKASIVWNALKDELVEAIDLEVRNSVDIAKITITPKNIEKIKDTHPERYAKCLELMKQKEFAVGIDTIAIPRNCDVPMWLIDFIDYTTIINDNLKVFPLEPIGVFKVNQNNNYTNIVAL